MRNTPITSKYYPNRVGSLKVCQEAGVRGVNSTLTLSVLPRFAWVVRALHMVPVKIIAPTILISLPDELTTFQVVIESG